MITPSRGAEALRRFLERNQIPLRVAGRALHVNHAAIVQWLQGKNIPNDANREAIAAWTGGTVKAESWLDADELKRRKRLSTIEPFDAERSTGRG